MPPVPLALGRSLLLVIACTFTLVVVVYALMFMLADHSLQGCGIAPRGQRASFYNAFAVRVGLGLGLGLGLRVGVRVRVRVQPSYPNPNPNQVRPRDTHHHRVRGAVRQGRVLQQLPRHAAANPSPTPSPNPSPTQACCSVF